MPKDMAASVRQRLRDLARTRSEDFDYVLRQYVMQRLLYRLSCSDYSEQFLLKGALLFWVWNEDFHRPTRDIDLLSFGDYDVPHLVDVFCQIVSIDKDDGLVFDVDSVTGIETKEDTDYPGVRLTGFANLAKARIPYQVDIGYGDVVIPEPEEAQLPSFLDFPATHLRVYPVYVVVAEKFQAMVMLGIANSRMKDFYDFKAIASTMELDGQILFDAIKATFERRKTDITTKALYVFSDEFKQDKDKQTQWTALLKKFNLRKKVISLMLLVSYNFSLNLFIKLLRNKLITSNDGCQISFNGRISNTDEFTPENISDIALICIYELPIPAIPPRRSLPPRKPIFTCQEKQSMPLINVLWWIMISMIC